MRSERGNVASAEGGWPFDSSQPTSLSIDCGRTLSAGMIRVSPVNIKMNYLMLIIINRFKQKISIVMLKIEIENDFLK